LHFLIFSKDGKRRVFKRKTSSKNTQVKQADTALRLYDGFLSTALKPTRVESASAGDN
jgi:hypothetical protein